ncbi:uncharacterized protein LOC123260183 isoform X4 [Cotesia glomerata]|uniref:uncharacterized protein LOC123260183 isoform X4 n=1 Tax=Cotesia glomerata TaxID=32391 RepID=UPI001D013D54|nr:uncharacterized protein LOC123260183 isoform X4 [Cotesia glomerata]
MYFFFSSCSYYLFFQKHLRIDDPKIPVIMEPPEISWENTLGSPNGVPFDDDTKQLVKDCMHVCTPPPVTLTTLIKRSEIFPIQFPIKTVRCSFLKERSIKTDILEFNSNSAYPIIHEAMLPLIAGWLKFKREQGSPIEKALYKNMGLIQFIQRLLDKRAVAFYGSDDRWKLIDKKSGEGGWEFVGTDQEKEPLVLSKCLSYDEIKLSAMMVVSSHTEFINDGARENRGVICNDSDAFQPRGVIMGVIGSRFERSRFMESQDIVISPLQNNMDNGYGPSVDGVPEIRELRTLWSRFYGQDYHPLYEQAVRRTKSKENKRYISLTNQTIFDVENYMKRTLLSVEIILLEANTRAEKQNTTAFLHVVGFGLDIKIHFALREPHSKLVRSTDADKLLVVTYAWDGNAFPGNEFWNGYLAASGDPAAACSSQISELHNPMINSRICGTSLHVASAEHGLLHISDYAKLHLA